MAWTGHDPFIEENSPKGPCSTWSLCQIVIDQDLPTGGFWAPRLTSKRLFIDTSTGRSWYTCSSCLSSYVVSICFGRVHSICDEKAGVSQSTETVLAKTAMTSDVHSITYRAKIVGSKGSAGLLWGAPCLYGATSRRDRHQARSGPWRKRFGIAALETVGDSSGFGSSAPLVAGS